MELRHLRYFLAVAEELNFRKAAERVRVSRPALSKQIKDLETEIGVRLLERDTVSVSLTKAGEIFLADARELLRLSNDAVHRANEAQEGRLGKLRIGSVGVIATDFLPGTLKMFHQAYPGVEVQFLETLPQEQLDALSKGVLDIGFAYGHEVSGGKDLRSLCVIRSTYGVAVSKHHPWAQRDSVPLVEATGATILCMGQGPRSMHLESIFHFCAEEGFIPGKIRTVEGIDSLLTLVAADQGVSMLPVVLDLATHGIVIIPLQAQLTNCEFRMWAVWRKNNQSQLVKHFIELLDERDSGSEDREGLEIGA